MRKLYRQFFPEVILKGECLYINSKEVPGRVMLVSGDICQISEDNFPLNICKKNIKHFLKTGHLWWGERSLYLDGIEIQGIIFKIKLDRRSLLLRNVSYYTTNFTSYNYQAFISGKLLEGRIFKITRDMKIFERGKLIDPESLA